MKSLGPLTLIAAIALASPAAANAVGATTYPSNGGATYGEPTVTQPATPKRKPTSVAARPQLQTFTVGPAVLTPGQAPTVSFKVKGRAPTIRLRLVVNLPDTASRTIDLGRLPANRPQTVTLSQLADPALPEGQMSVRITGRDSAGRILRPAAHTSSVSNVQIRGHVFPLRGVFSYGTAADRFGAVRSGHTHQGQDLLADEGTPIVAPRAGTIEYVGYQKSAAGYYVVLDGDNEIYDYAFMHMEEGSITVQQGQHVDQGQRLGSVGHTGDAEGNHLHFEMWPGKWWGDGIQPIDPLPFLQQWQTWSPVRAI